MLATDTMTPRPRPPAQIRRSLAQGASPPPPYFLENGRKPNYLGSPLPATLQMVGMSQPGSPAADLDENMDWLNERSREELAELLLKADGLIKDRETELGVTSAVCKSLHESNVTLMSRHEALVARIPATPRHSPPISHVSFADGLHTRSVTPDSSFDADGSPRVYIKRHARRISVSPADISLLSDQNAELLLKLENLEAEALSADRTGRRALKQLEREIQLLRDELEKTQARSEQLEKTAQAGTEKIVEEMWKKKKEREAKFRAMRNNTSVPTYDDDTEIRDFAPPGLFSKPSLSPSQSTEFPFDESYEHEPAFEHPHQHTLVAQLLSKIQELEETNAQIIHQQSETAEKLHAVQRETESISKVYECFSAENGMEWEVVGDDGIKSPMEGTIRFRSFRRSLEVQSDVRFPSLAVPRRARKSVLDLFDAANAAGPSRLALPPAHDTISSASELSPLRFDTSQSQLHYDNSPFLGSRPTLQAELGDDFNNEAFDPFSRRGSLYDLSFSVSPSPMSGARSLKGRVSDTKASRDQTTPTHNALQLSVEPLSPEDAGSVRGKSTDRFRRMSQTLSLRTSRWVDGRFPGAAARIFDESTPKRQSVSLPQRLSSALDVVMENFGGAVRDAEHPAPPAPSPVIDPVATKAENSVLVDDNRRRKQALTRFLLEVWLWLQFAIIILVFLFAMARQGPRNVIGEAERRALVKRR
ncbi:hypothetical protein DFH07DRAFT_1065326 [Mycena maculata]|uniref:Uncharacterized protein n=1 Tax=Mycena maculata TaxID=230809 RepID=A0AAD7I321_9AGAR|nr:hypothetical protein DFH07DRAFT_1065326 [Mycena maculata]